LTRIWYFDHILIVEVRHEVIFIIVSANVSWLRNLLSHQ